MSLGLQAKLSKKSHQTNPSHTGKGLRDLERVNLKIT